MSFVVVVMAAALWVSACASDPPFTASLPSTPSGAQETTLGPGESGPLGPLRLTVTRIEDRTSSGCLGGPRGCEDAVDLQVAFEGQVEAVRLRVPRTEEEREAHVDQARVFGHILALKAFRPEQVTLTLQPER